MRYLRLGSLQLIPITYAPLAGYSDYPFRQITRLFHKGLHFCEMVKMEALLREVPATLAMLEYSAAMKPLGAQLVGSKEELAGEAAAKIEALGFDTVELNCGCPVDKVTKDGSGSALLRSPDKIGRIIERMVQAVKIPVTIKIRLGWDAHTVCYEEITSIAEAAGAQAITIHGRTRQQAFTGPAQWEPIRQCKQVARSIQVIGNGDVFSYQDALRMFHETECDGVCIARGMLGQPWISSQIMDALAGEAITERTDTDTREVLLRHLEASTAYKNPQQALLDMKRMGCWYCKHKAYAKRLRQALTQATSLEECRTLIEQHFVGESQRSQERVVL